MTTIKSMTYGQVPNFEDYSAQWDKLLAEGELAGGLYHISNCKRVGTTTFTKEGLYDELQKAVAEWEDPEDGEDYEAAGDWASCVLTTLGFEWV